MSTRLTLRTMRADDLHRLLRSPRGRVVAADDIHRLSDLWSWPRLQIDVAVADLLADGRLADHDGRLVVKR